MKVCTAGWLAASTSKLGLCALLCVSGVASGSDSILIGTGDCDSGVHLQARGARLPDVLSRLSDVLGFQFQLAGASDSIVDVDASSQAPERVAKLSPLDDVIVTQARDPRCPGKYRLVTV